MTNLIGQSLGRYHILEQLGEGGMAIVYKAYDTRLETDVAIKVIRTENLTLGTMERGLKRFEREAKSLAKLTHPNIVKVTDYGEFDGKPYLVMSYLPGGTLKEKLGKPLGWQEAARLLLPVARALDFAHRQNMIHRDVKSSNILITLDGEPMLTDFGIAKILDLEDTVDLTGTGMSIGTPEYMAPEQWTGGATQLSDQYSLGVVFYEMLTGRRPYSADTPAAILLKQANDPLPRPSQFARDLPERVEKMVLKALAKNPADRYASMGAFASALDGLTSAPVQSGQEKPARPREQTRTVNEQVAAADTIRETPRPYYSAAPKETPAYLRYWPVLGLLLLVGIVALMNRNDGGAVPTQSAASPLAATEAPIATEAPAVFDEIMDIQGIPMRFVPAGNFSMGSEDGSSDEQPVHTVYVDDFYMDKYEVSNAAYSDCVNSGACQPPANTSSYTRDSYYNNSQYDDYPVIYVDWNMAGAYCEWRGARLPGEAEWEKAARGTDGRIYPWGDSFDGAKTNFCDKNCPFGHADENYDDGYADTAPVDAFSSGISPYGIFNLAGNVWEWVSDWYDAYPGNTVSDDYYGTTYRVLRGGSWNDLDDNVRSAFRIRNTPDNTGFNIGFRCARSLE